MTDSAYIPPSDREFDIEDCYEIDAFGSECHGIEKLRASHAVVDSVAADLAERMRPLIEFAERTAINYDDLAASKACRQAVGTLKRYDALHKEAEQ